MNSIDLEFILLGLVFASFIFIFFNNLTSSSNKILVWLSRQSKSFLPILIIVIILRSFIAEPFKIPSGSMIPTLLVGDFILVNKYEYGIRLPITKTLIIRTSYPKRGDVIVFRYPKDKNVNFIKRVIGIPGDKITYVNKKLYVNGKKISKSVYIEKDKKHPYERLPIFLEKIDNKKYTIMDDNFYPEDNFKIEVPENNYFVMGDNRDHSSDSRVWGFVPNDNLVGRAFYIWMNFDNYGFNFKRIGTTIE